MKNEADYSLYECPYAHIEKECGHKLEGPEGFDDAHGVWCACGFRAPVFVLSPKALGLNKKDVEETAHVLVRLEVESVDCPNCSVYNHLDVSDFIKNADAIWYIKDHQCKSCGKFFDVEIDAI
jgi:hypothetical protein